ncbi:ADC synthase [Kockiozyma suomiensis]|uniref:ADC synthase n=1 Tax=Kockiozyma suomiensis TaxID=1337062 RepID=UPI003343DA92
MARYDILIIDSYDSFTFNLVALLQSLSFYPRITVISSEALLPSCLPQSILPAFLAYFDAIIIGPGPGTPEHQDADMGGIPRVWATIEQSHASLGIPPPLVIGVCLGFQWMLLSSGHRVLRLPKPRHGLISILDLTDAGKSDMYTGLADKDIECVRYHSLYVAFNPQLANDIIPLAWTRDRDENNNKILMAARHRVRPFWAVQYHPESICSQYGSEIFENIFSIAESHILGRRQFITEKLHDGLADSSHALQAYLSSQSHSHHMLNDRRSTSITDKMQEKKRSLHQRTIQLPDTLDMLDFVPNLCQRLFTSVGPLTLLDSAAAPGKWTYIGSASEHTRNFTYCLPDDFMTEITGKNKCTKTFKVNGIKDVWDILAQTMDFEIDYIATDDSNRKSTSDYIKHISAKDSPSYPSFYGGLVGYVSYEAGVVDNLGIGIDKESKASVPDINLTLYERTLAIDLEHKLVFLHTIESENSFDDDAEWMLKCESQISLLVNPLSEQAEFNHDHRVKAKKNFTSITQPDGEHYRAKIEQAQEYLASGDSYELCVTDQTSIKETVSPGTTMLSDWAFYKHMRRLNPAPYSCFYHTSTNTLIGMSPERFLSWDDNRQTCELRPIKGTVKNDRHTTIESATARLNTPKERAENLMIVDLIRHDLAQFCQSVTVTKLMGVEVYKTVYQLVSVIRGTQYLDNVSGIDVLRGCLPPGSMTGAPKRRSVELLQQLESHRRRGVYSGVSGYWSVLGYGDWSVVIRSAYSLLNNTDDNEREWRIGAGGAITALSDCDEEWDEMKVKLQSALQSFCI